MTLDLSAPLVGGVIVDFRRHSHGIVELLTYHLRKRVALQYYQHPYEIEVDLPHAFMIVLSFDALEGVVRAYEARGLIVPLILHIDAPEVFDQIDYDRQFPGVEVVPVEQANLDGGPDVTLKIGLFRQVIEELERRV